MKKKLPVTKVRHRWVKSFSLGGAEKCSRCGVQRIDHFIAGVWAASFSRWVERGEKVPECGGKKP